MNNTTQNTKGKKGLSIGLMILAVVLLVFFDQLTKFLAVAHLRGKAPAVLIPGVLELQYLENDGAAFSMLRGQQWFFYLLTAFFLVIAIWILRKIPAEKRFNPLRWSLLLLCAGAIGNLIDRIVHKYVVDFIYFSIINFPIFNVADIYVTFGVIFLIVLILFYYKEEDIRRIFSKKADQN